MGDLCPLHCVAVNGTDAEETAPVGVVCHGLLSGLFSGVRGWVDQIAEKSISVTLSNR